MGKLIRSLPTGASSFLSLTRHRSGYLLCNCAHLVSFLVDAVDLVICFRGGLQIQRAGLLSWYLGPGWLQHGIHSTLSIYKPGPKSVCALRTGQIELWGR